MVWNPLSLRGVTSTYAASLSERGHISARIRHSMTASPGLMVHALEVSDEVRAALLHSSQVHIELVPAGVVVMDQAVSWIVRSPYTRPAKHPWCGR